MAHAGRKTIKLLVTHNMQGMGPFYYAKPLYFKGIGACINKVNLISWRFTKLHVNMGLNMFSCKRYTTTTAISFNLKTKTVTLRLTATTYAQVPQATIVNGAIIYRTGNNAIA